MLVLVVSPGIMAQSKLFASVFLGTLCMWFCYDLLRLWRRILHHGAFWMGVEDLVFFLVWAMIGFEKLYEQSRGQIKGFMILAALVGTGVYYIFAGRFLVRKGGRMICRAKVGIRSMLKNKQKSNKKEEIPIEK